MVRIHAGQLPLSATVYGRRAFLEAFERPFRKKQEFQRCPTLRDIVARCHLIVAVSWQIEHDKPVRIEACRWRSSKAWAWKATARRP